MHVTPIIWVVQETLAFQRKVLFRRITMILAASPLDWWVAIILSARCYAACVGGNGLTAIRDAEAFGSTLGIRSECRANALGYC
ncbi:hypothetical protein BDZ97DRAFT_1847066 [Flammula alnicola]|nr:hypothetical protein BDZ97DRAFT_1847066 [Flammula alnicola]